MLSHATYVSFHDNTRESLHLYLQINYICLCHYTFLIILHNPAQYSPVDSAEYINPIFCFLFNFLCPNWKYMSCECDVPGYWDMHCKITGTGFEIEIHWHVTLPSTILI
jgi:hypothetical protein